MVELNEPQRGNTMTRKDYEIIASVLSNSDEVIDQDAIDALAEMFADKLERYNPNFKRDIFIIKATNTTQRRQEFLELLNK
jgi:hypothetical protein